MTQAVETAIERELPALLAYFSRRVSVPEDAADLLGETLLVVWRRRSSIPATDAEARMWLFGVARKVLSQHYRASRRRSSLGERLRLEISHWRVDQQPADGAEVREAIAKLPRDDRELVRLVHWDGLPLTEAATVLGIAAGTARMRYQRAREKLRSLLA